jgi:hypothetical protein
MCECAGMSLEPGRAHCMARGDAMSVVFAYDDNRRGGAQLESRSDDRLKRRRSGA